MDAPSSIERTLRRILDEAVIVAVRLGEADPLIDVCQALTRGGLIVLEITLTTPGALRAIEALTGDNNLIVGGGTVLSPDDVRRVAGAGGRFVLSPVTNDAVIAEAHKHGLVAVPGSATPNEILRAYQSGADLVKVFPSGPLGGPDYLKRIRGPLPGIPLVPTNGPTAADLADYFAVGAVAVGVGGEELFAPGFTPDTVERAARRIRDAVDATHR
jgi:2-dehydro-3-deoxyphosphogluconate aldolase / (4S)-4-hydroxy-2-oxoglutarate aldolase